MLMKLLALLFFSMALQLAGCALSKGVETPLGIPAPKEEPQLAPQDLVARDFVSALQQLESLLPADTTVDMQRSDRRDDFTQAMLHALQQVGYGIRWVSAEDTVTLLQYRLAVSDAAASARRETYELAVGPVEMRREYVSDGQRIRPVSPLYVRGADASAIVPRDDLFDRVELSLPADANPLDPVISRAMSPALRSLPLVSVPTLENVYELGQSNFANALAGRTLVAEQILVFGNDSLRLGVQNKKLVEEMVRRFDPATDVFSVIGCSMGPTRVSGGNAALALGRAGRVVEALRFAGVDDKRIFDEGCWAGGGSLDELPHRGVVLTLNRQQ